MMQPVVQVVRVGRMHAAKALLLLASDACPASLAGLAASGGGGRPGPLW